MIDDLEDLYRIAHLMNVRVIYKNLHEKEPRLEGYAWPDRKLIVLDKSLVCRAMDHVCVLAEEIGHILYPPVYKISYHLDSFWQLDYATRSETRYRHSKVERSALVWATSFLIPDEAFWDFAKTGPYNWWEWLEHFEVTDWFMRWKIGFMQTKTKLKCRNIIKRVPPLIIAVFMSYWVIDIFRQIAT